MKQILFFIAFFTSLQMLGIEPQLRILLKDYEASDMEIAELPGVGLCLNLDGDSLIFLDDPELPVIHMESKRDARKIIVCDSVVYSAVGNAVYADTCTIPTIVLDNEMFEIYPAWKSSFYVCTSDSAFSNLILVDPASSAYSLISEINAPIHKIVANDTHTLALINDEIVALGADNENVTLYEGAGINDMALSPMGLFIATEDGLYLSPKQSELQLWSERKFKRVWWIGLSLYLQDCEGNLYAVDNLAVEE